MDKDEAGRFQRLDNQSTKKKMPMPRHKTPAIQNAALIAPNRLSVMPTAPNAMATITSASSFWAACPAGSTALLTEGSYSRSLDSLRNWRSARTSSLRFRCCNGVAGFSWVNEVVAIDPVVTELVAIDSEPADWVAGYPLAISAGMPDEKVGDVEAVNSCVSVLSLDAVKYSGAIVRSADG